MPKVVRRGLRESSKLLPLKVAARQMAKATGIPPAALSYITSQVSFDDREARNNFV